MNDMNNDSNKSPHVNEQPLEPSGNTAPGAPLNQKPDEQLSTGAGTASSPQEVGQAAQSGDKAVPAPADGSAACPEPVEGSALLDDLAAVLRNFVVLPKWATETLALWILHTYAYQMRDVSTYIGLESPEKRCGKTTLLSVLEALVNRPVIAANISPPALFRVIEGTRPTLLIDEADTFLQGNEELRGILNSGYTRKSAYVVRVSNQQNRPRSTDHRPLGESKIQSPSSFAKATEDKKSKVEDSSMFDRHPTVLDAAAHLTHLTHLTSSPGLARFSCWCPKIMAAIGKLPDTLADRCIVIRMHRKMAGEQCQRLRDLQGGDLRDRCARYVADNGQAISEARPKIPQDLNDRASDVWEPLLVLADLAGGKWPRLARDAAVGLSARAQEASPIASLLLDVFCAFATAEAERLFSRQVVGFLGGRPDRPWREAMNGKDLNEQWLAQQLRPYGLRPRTLRIGESQGKGYVRAEVVELCRRYISASELKAMLNEDKEVDT